MALQPWEHLGEETLTRFKIFEVVRAQRRSPRTDAVHGMFTVRTWDWVQVVPITEDGDLVVVRQYRQGSEAFSLEIPGGVVTPGEDPAVAAVRELREETGYEAAAWRSLGCTNPNPALFTNSMHAYAALGCRRVGEPELDPGEDLEVEVMSPRAFADLARNGGVDNALVFAALYLHGLAADEPDQNSV